MTATLTGTATPAVENRARIQPARSCAHPAAVPFPAELIEQQLRRSATLQPHSGTHRTVQQSSRRERVSIGAVTAVTALLVTTAVAGWTLNSAGFWWQATLSIIAVALLAIDSPRQRRVTTFGLTPDALSPLARFVFDEGELALADLRRSTRKSHRFVRPTRTAADRITSGLSELISDINQRDAAIAMAGGLLNTPATRALAEYRNLSADAAFAAIADMKAAAAAHRTQPNCHAIRARHYRPTVSRWIRRGSAVTTPAQVNLATGCQHLARIARYLACE